MARNSNKDIDFLSVYKTKKKINTNKNENTLAYRITCFTHSYFCDKYTLFNNH